MKFRKAQFNDMKRVLKGLKQGQITNVIQSLYITLLPASNPQNTQLDMPSQLNTLDMKCLEKLTWLI